MSRVKQLELAPAQLPASPSYTVLYTVGSGYKAQISISICNDDASNVTFSLWKVPAGGSPSNANLLVNQRQIPALQTDRVPELAGQTFAAGTTLQGNASAATQATVTGGIVLITEATP